MADLQTSIIVSLSGNVQGRAREMTQGLTNLGRRGAASMRMLSQGVSAAGRGLDRLGNRYTALIGGAAGIGAVRMVGNLEERFTRMGIQANRSAADMDVLKKQIFEVAKASDIRVDPGQITAAVEEIIEKTGDLKYAEENLRNIGLALQATGAQGQAIGGIMAEFQKLDKNASPAKVLEALDLLTVQGKEGAFTMAELAALGPRVFAAYGAMRKTGITDFSREMGAVLQVIRQATGNSEQAATTFEGLMRVMSDSKKLKALQKLGVSVFDPKALKKGREELRPINELMIEIFTAARGRSTVLDSVIGDGEALRAFKASGLVENIRRFYQVQADGSAITGDSARAAKGFNAALTNLWTVWQQFADKELAEPVKQLTEYLDGLKPGTVERWMQIGKNIALVGGGLIVAGKVLGGGKSIYDFFGRRRALKGAANMAGGMAGVVPVYVVNGDAGFSPGTGQTATKGGPAIAGAAKKLAAASVAAPVGYAIGSLLTEINGYVVGKLSGDKYSKGWMGEAMYDFTHTDNGQWRVIALMEQLLNKQSEPAELKISIQSDGQARVQSMRPGSGLEMDVDSGRTMVTP